MPVPVYNKKRNQASLRLVCALAAAIAFPMATSGHEDNPDVQLQTGLRYYLGDGVARDAYEAFAWLNLSANHGNPVAQLMLADMYMTGDGCVVDPVMAYLWLSLASIQQQEGATERLFELAESMDVEQHAAAAALLENWLSHHVVAASH